MSAALQGHTPGGDSSGAGTLGGANPWGTPPRPIPAPPPPLLELLGARWAMDAPVTGVAWDGEVAAFALGDGSIALARCEWDGAPRLAPRDGGGMAVTPATAPPPPVSRQRVHDGACLAIAADPAEPGFLSGGDDGRLVHSDADGRMTLVAELPGEWVDLVAAGGAGFSAGAAGRQVHVRGPGGFAASVALPASATALAFDATGRTLAMAHYRGVTLWSPDLPTRLLPTRGFPRSVAWSPDGAYVVCGLQENALHGWRLADGGDLQMGGYPGQPRSVAFSADGRFLASSGAPRVVCWGFDPPLAGQLPVECGLPASRMPVCRVACHPVHPLVAAGYHNGAVLLCQPGTDEVLFARGSGIAPGEPADGPTGSGPLGSGASISALAWSADGERLAMATSGGDIGVVALPPRLFRFAPRAPASASTTGIRQCES